MPPKNLGLPPGLVPLMGAQTSDQSAPTLRAATQGHPHWHCAPNLRTPGKILVNLKLTCGLPAPPAAHRPRRLALARHLLRAGLWNPAQRSGGLGPQLGASQPLPAGPSRLRSQRHRVPQPASHLRAGSWQSKLAGQEKGCHGAPARIRAHTQPIRGPQLPLSVPCPFTAS